MLSFFFVAEEIYEVLNFLLHLFVVKSFLMSEMPQRLALI